MKNIKYLIVGVLVLSIAVFGFLNYKKSRYTVEVNLTAEQRADYESKVVLMDGKIKAVKPPEKPDIDYFIEKARYQEYLGLYSDAITTLLDSFKYYQNTSAGWNNIAKLYDKVGDYKSAIFFYSKLIDTFSLNRYYLDIAWDYYRLGKLSLAQEAYGRFAQLAGSKDIELFNILYNKKP